MNNHNVHFDIDKKKIGISKSSCIYDNIVTIDDKGRRADDIADILFDKSGRIKKRINDRKKKPKKAKRQPSHSSNTTKSNDSKGKKLNQLS